MACEEVCAGELRHAVSYQEAIRTPNSSGGTGSPVWSEQAVLMCKIRELSGKEAFMHHRLESQAVAEFTARYRSDLKTEGRLVVDGESFNIRWLNDVDRRKRWIKIVAERGVVD